MSTQESQTTRTQNRRECNGHEENEIETGISLSLAEAHTPADESQQNEGKEVVERAPIKCPRCGGELDPAPYASWACWSYSERIHVHDQGGEGR